MQWLQNYCVFALEITDIRILQPLMWCAVGWKGIISIAYILKKFEQFSKMESGLNWAKYGWIGKRLIFHLDMRKQHLIRVVAKILNDRWATAPDLSLDVSTDTYLWKYDYRGKYLSTKRGSRRLENVVHEFRTAKEAIDSFFLEIDGLGQKR